MNPAYSQALDFLYGLRLFGTKLGLENTRELAARADNPHRGLRFIHVAGTNGKGSTCAMLESIYRTAGRRVGLFTSPHLVSFRERIQVNRAMIGEADVVRLVAQAQRWMQGFPESRHPTFFEVVTLMALRYFVERHCDLVIWETGLGGRLDATNIVTPLAAVITNIQLDHEKWLGSTLAEIAAEKAGIIKPGVPTLTATEAPPAFEVIRQTAATRHSPLTCVSSADTQVPPLNQLRLPLLGEHQRLNAALALATIRLLQPQLPVDETAARLGLENVQWAGRLQLQKRSESQAILLDGAHNPAGAATLRQTLLQEFPSRRPTLVLGILRDKDWNTICQLLAPLAVRILVAPVQSERTATVAELEAACRAANPQAEIVACASLSEALTRAGEDAFVVVTGSLYLVGEALELLDLAPSADRERPLNEWGEASRSSAPQPAATR